jgi:hypothetical protein
MKTILSAIVASAIALAGAAHAADTVHHQLKLSSGVFGCTKPATSERGLQVSVSGDQEQMSRFIDATIASGDCAGIPAGTVVTTGRGFPGDTPPNSMLVELSAPGHAAPLWVPMGLIVNDMMGVK